MPRKYTPDDRDFAMQRLAHNFGDVALTARQLGISIPTLHRWKRLRLDSQYSLSSLSSNRSQPDSKSLSVHGEGFREGLPPDDLHALLKLKAGMLELAEYILTSSDIKRAIDQASLQQRIAALAQLTDRILKLGIELPPEEDKFKAWLQEEFAGEEPNEPDEEDDEYADEPIAEAPSWSAYHS